MRTVNIIGTGIVLRDRKKGERKEGYKNYCNAIERFNIFVNNLNGRKISITRMTQALCLLEYCRASSRKSAPRFYVVGLNSVDSTTAEIVLQENFKKVAKWNLV